MQDFIKLKQQLEILWQEVEKLERETPEPGPGGTTDYNELSNRPSINGNLLTGNKTSSQLGLITASDITDAFTPSTISIEEGGTFPSDARTLLTEHKPIMINSTQYWFLEESGVDYLYGSIPLSGAYPTITYFRVMKADFTVEFHETATDTVPTDNSNNFITSGGVYTAIQAAGGGGTDLTPIEITIPSNNIIPSEYQYVIDKHLPFNGYTFVGTQGNNLYYCNIRFNENNPYPVDFFAAIVNKTTYKYTPVSNTGSRVSLLTDKALGETFYGNGSIKGTLSSNVNLNNQTSSGIYEGENSGSMTNCPVTGGFILTVDTRSFILQELRPVDNPGKIYRRNRVAGSVWTNWFEFSGTEIIPTP